MAAGSYPVMSTPEGVDVVVHEPWCVDHVSEFFEECSRPVAVLPQRGRDSNVSVRVTRYAAPSEDWQGDPLVEIGDGCGGCDTLSLTFEAATTLAAVLSAIVGLPAGPAHRPKDAPQGYGTPEVPSAASGLPTLLTEAQVAAYLGLSVPTTRRLARQDDLQPGSGLPSRRAGRKRLFTQDDVQTFVERRQAVTPTGRALRPEDRLALAEGRRPRRAVGGVPGRAYRGRVG